MARSFNGSTAYLSQGSAFAGGSLGNLLLSFWLRTTTSATLVSVCGVIETGTAGACRVQLNTDSTFGAAANKTCVIIRNNAGTTSDFYHFVSSTPYDGNWHHHAVVRDGSTSIYYLDGVAQTLVYAVNTLTTTAITFTRPMTFGAQNNRGTIDQFSAIELHEVNIFTGSLIDSTTAPDLAAMLALSSPKGLEAFGLANAYPLWGYQSPEIDEVGGNDLTITGTALVDAPPGIAYPSRRSIYFPAPSGAYNLVCDAGSYAQNGQAALLKKGSVIGIAQGSYVQNGQASLLKFGRLIQAAQGSYAVNGQAAGLQRSWIMTAAQGAYIVTGQNPNLLRGLYLTPTIFSNTYFVNNTFGSPPVYNFYYGRVIAPDAGSYAVNGQTAALSASRTMSVVQGAYSVNGQAANLVKTSANTISIEAGFYSVSGQAAALNVGHKMPAAQGGYLVNGQAAGTLVGRKLQSDQGAYALNGQAAGFSRTYQMAAIFGAYTLNGRPAQLTWSGSPLAPRALCATISVSSYTATVTQSSLSATIEEGC